MNRHLHNSMLAFSATGLLLLAGLLAAVAGKQAAPADLVVNAAASGSPAGSRTAAQANRGRNAAIQGRVPIFEARIQRSASATELLAETAAFTAGIAAETALITAFAQPSDPAARAHADRQHRRQVRRSRAALALPYFSFAQGLRHNRS